MTTEKLSVGMRDTLDEIAQKVRLLELAVLGLREWGSVVKPEQFDPLDTLADEIATALEALGKTEEEEGI
jgi:hypothetical protein